MLALRASSPEYSVNPHPSRACRSASTVSALGSLTVDFEAMEEFDWRTADIKPSPRGGEMRYVATGRMGVRLHRAVFTLRGERVRIISLREANRREVRNYERP